MCELTLQDYSVFFPLSFREKLDYWDKKALDFECDSYYIDKYTLISLFPANLEQRILYNRWVIDHYRYELQKGVRGNFEAGLGARYKSFDEHKKYYEGQVADLGVTKKEAFINSQVDYVDLFLKKRPISKDALKFVHKCINTDQETEIFCYAKSLKFLKEIAKALDIVKYWVLLRRERKALSDAPSHRATYKVVPSSEDKIRQLYQDLITHAYIHPETNECFFVDLFSNRDVDVKQRIKWIDDVGASNNLVRKATLVVLITYTVLWDTQDQNKFICDFFEIYEAVKDGSSGLRKGYVPTARMLTDARKPKPETERKKLIKKLAQSLRK